MNNLQSWPINLGRSDRKKTWLAAWTQAGRVQRFVDAMHRFWQTIASTEYVVSGMHTVPVDRVDVSLDYTRVCFFFQFNERVRISWVEFTVSSHDYVVFSPSLKLCSHRHWQYWLFAPGSFMSDSISYVDCPIGKDRSTNHWRYSNKGVQSDWSQGTRQSRVEVQKHSFVLQKGTKAQEASCPWKKDDCVLESIIRHCLRLQSIWFWSSGPGR